MPSHAQATIHQLAQWRDLKLWTFNAFIITSWFWNNCYFAQGLNPSIAVRERMKWSIIIRKWSNHFRTSNRLSSISHRQLSITATTAAQGASSTNEPKDFRTLTHSAFREATVRVHPRVRSSARDTLTFRRSGPLSHTDNGSFIRQLLWWISRNPDYAIAKWLIPWVGVTPNRNRLKWKALY